MCVQRYKKGNIDEFGYGKGYTYLTEEFKRLLDALDEAIDAGLHVVCNAHAKPRKFELPEEMGSFDRYELKLTKNTAPIVKEWCDCLLFCNFKTYVITDESNKKKAQGNKRVIYTSHSAVYDAKNRVGLPDEMDMDFANLKPLFEGKEATTKEEPLNEVASKIRKMCADSGITEDELKGVVALKKKYPIETPIEEYSNDFVARWILPNWSKIVEMIKTNGGTN